MPEKEETAEGGRGRGNTIYFVRLQPCLHGISLIRRRRRRRCSVPSSARVLTVVPPPPRPPPFCVCLERWENMHYLLFMDLRAALADLLVSPASFSPFFLRVPPSAKKKPPFPPLLFSQPFLERCLHPFLLLPLSHKCN